MKTWLSRKWSGQRSRVNFKTSLQRNFTEANEFNGRGELHVKREANNSNDRILTFQIVQEKVTSKQMLSYRDSYSATKEKEDISRVTKRVQLYRIKYAKLPSAVNASNENAHKATRSDVFRGTDKIITGRKTRHRQGKRRTCQEPLT